MKKNIFLGVLLCITPFLYSQTSITSSGITNSSNSGSVAFTLGQLVYTTASSNTGSVAQGVQQPFEFQVLSVLDDKSMILTLTTYPNPTSGELVLKTSNTPQDKLEYALFDLQGKQLKSGRIIDTKTTIEIQDISNGVYLLKVTKSNLLLKALKIIKK
ncbi:T9SS type A sorting domain-containing protein [Polaribacter sp. M15]